MFGVCFPILQAIANMILFQPVHLTVINFIAVINVTISPGSYQVEESDTTVLFNVSRNDDVILDRNVSVRVTTNAVNAGGM